jgi:hypothetical protein
MNIRRKKRNYPSFGEREYGKDNRILSAILYACAQSVNKNGIGTIWQGRENKGYLCANSLRLIAAPRLPQYSDDTIPGQKITDSLTWVGEHRDQDGFREGKRKRRKFEGVEVDEEAGSTIDEIDLSFAREFLNKDERRKEEYRRATPEDIWRLKYGNEDNMRENGEKVALQAKSTNSRSDNISNDIIDADYKAKAESSPTQESSETDLFPDARFDADHDAMLESFPAQESSDITGFEYDPELGTTRSLRSEAEYEERIEAHKTSSIQSDESCDDTKEEEMFFDTDIMRWRTRPKDATRPKQAKNVTSEPKKSDEASDLDNGSDDDTEMYFDSDEMRWKTRSRVEKDAAKLTTFEAGALSESDEFEVENDEEKAVSIVSVVSRRRAHCTLPVTQLSCYA